MDVAKMVLEQDFATEEKERLRKQNINLEVEVGSIMVENDIVKEKLDDALDTIDDIEAHKLSQELEQNKKEKEKEAESQNQGTIGQQINEEDNEQESQNQCTIGLQSNEECNDEIEVEFVNEEHRDEIMGPCDKKQEEDNDSTEPKQSDHEMVTDEDLEQTITAACKGLGVEETQKKKPHRQKVEIDPSSLVKRVTRSGKRIQDYIYTEDEKEKKNVEDDKKKDAERQKKEKEEKQKWIPQKSRLYHMLEQEDRDLLDQICDCET